MTGLDWMSSRKLLRSLPTVAGHAAEKKFAAANFFSEGGQDRKLVRDWKVTATMIARIGGPDPAYSFDGPVAGGSSLQ